MCTGKLPTPGLTVRSLNPILPPIFDEVICRCLSQDPANRPTSLKEALKTAMPPAGLVPVPITDPCPSPGVYWADDPILKRKVVVTMFPQKGDRQQFLGEARARARLDSPYVVKIFDIAVQPEAGQKDRTYVVSEFVPGQSLEQFLDGKGIPDAAELHGRLRLFGQLLKGLDYMHNYGIVHGRLRPDNVLISEEGQVKIWGHWP
jgi:serine/threonine protein kinase